VCVCVYGGEKGKGWLVVDVSTYTVIKDKKRRRRASFREQYAPCFKEQVDLSLRKKKQ
jgi:hypothetical protein